MEKIPEPPLLGNTDVGNPRHHQKDTRTNYKGQRKKTLYFFKRQRHPNTDNYTKNCYPN